MKLIEAAAAVLLALWLGAPPASASPPACHRSDLDRFLIADAVVRGPVESSRRWLEGATTLHLVATYRATEVFKGEPVAGDAVIVTHTCLEEDFPPEVAGYPGVQRYCPGGRGLRLTGVDPADGAALPGDGPAAPEWVLFLAADRRPGAPQLTWTEVGHTGFGGGCRRTVDDLDPEQRRTWERLTLDLDQARP